MEFDLEDRLDGVMENWHCWGVFGVYAECAVETEEFVAERGGGRREVRFLFIFGFFSLWVADARSTEKTWM